MPIFDAASLEKQVNKALTDIPAGYKGALVAVATIDGHIELRVATKIGGAWQLGAVISKAPGSQVQGMVQVKRYW